MAITRVGHATTKISGTGTGTSITTALPAGIAAGDLLVLEVATGVGPFDLTDPAGWTHLRRIGDPSSGGYESALEVWWKVAGASESAPSLTASGATRWHTHIRAFRGVTAAAPFLAEAAAEEEGGSTTTVHAAPPITNTDPGAWALFSLVSRKVATPYTATPGAGLTERVDQDTGSGSAASNLLYFSADSNGPVAAGTVTYSATGSSGSSNGVQWAAFLSPAASGVVTGVTATVNVSAPAGTVGGGVPVAASVAGVTAQVVVQGGNTPTPAPPPAPGSWPPDPYRQAIRGPVTIFYTVDASLDGTPVAGATDMRPIGGAVVDTTKPGVRRTLNLTLAPEPGLFDKLAPIGTLLTVTANVMYADRSTFPLKMGVFDVDSQSVSEGAGGLSLTAPDKWARIQRARFLTPYASTPGVTVQTQIGAIIRGALGAAEPINDYTTRAAKVGALVWEKDRDKAIIDLAASIGAWVYFDRDGVATIADVPQIGQSADWLIDASATGVLTELDRERSRTGAYNVVVVSSSAADGALFATQIVWDNDPTSPTYAGTDPLNAPETAGPFGIVPYFYDTPILSTVEAARQAGYTILARVSGMASQVSLGAVPNPAIEAFAVLDVLPVRERYDMPRVMERHVADTVTHPLTLGAAQQIEGRSTRTEEWA